MRVLIVLPGAIGDVVRALPLLGRLRRARPEAYVGWAVEPASAPLLVGHPWLDEVIVFERAAGARAFLPFLRRVRAGGWTMALDLGRSLKSGIVARASAARRRVGFARRDGRELNWLFSNVRIARQGIEKPKIEQFLAFGDVLGLPAAPVEFGLAPTAGEAREADVLLQGLPRPIVAACLGSSCSSRRWFADRTAAVLHALRERDRASAVLLGTAADASFAAEVVRRSDGGVRDLVGRTSLRQLLAILGRADLAFGPDSGALHVAAAVGVPTVSLWGATSAARSAPWGSEHLAVTGSAPCAPCFLTTCPIERVCMRAITPADVTAAWGGARRGA